MSNGFTIYFNRGMDSTHDPQVLPDGYGVLCVDANLRNGNLAPRPEAKNVLCYNWASFPAVFWHHPLAMFPFRTMDGKWAILIQNSGPLGNAQVPHRADIGFLAVIKDIDFDYEETYPSNIYAHFIRPIETRRGLEMQCQNIEPGEFVGLGENIYGVNIGASSPLSPIDRWFGCIKVNANTLKGEYLDNWPKARHIAIYKNYVILLNLYSEGTNAVFSSSIPITVGEPIWGEIYDYLPCPPGDEIMKGVIFRDTLYVFTKTSVWAYMGPPPEWERVLILPNIGTSSSESVQVIGDYIYFLASDGTVRRMSGAKNDVEEVGAYTPDKKSPISNTLNYYQISDAENVSVIKWNTRGDFQRALYQQDIEITDEGVKLKQEDIVCVDDDGQPEPTVKYVIYYKGERDNWQTFYITSGTKIADVDISQNGFILKKISILITGKKLGQYELCLKIGKHISSTIPNSEIEVLGEKTQTITISNINIEQEITFEFDEDIVLDWSNIGPTPTFRIIVELISGPEHLFWLGHHSGGSPSKRHSYGPGAVAKYKVFGTIYKPVGQIVAKGNISSGQLWRMLAWAKSDNGGSITMKVGPNAITRFEVKNNLGSYIGALVPDTTAYWRAILWPNLGRLRSPVLHGVFLSYYTTNVSPIEKPTSAAWDGRYCLALKRKESSKRDLFVWDNNAWVIWLARSTDFQNGIMRMAVVSDRLNRPRLLFFDTELVRGMCGQEANFVPLYAFLLPEIKTNQNTISPAFISKAFLVSGGYVGKIREFFVRYKDFKGCRGSFNFFMSMDNQEWINLGFEINGEGRNKLLTFWPPPNEGRVFQFVIGKIPKDFWKDVASKVSGIVFYPEYQTIPPVPVETKEIACSVLPIGFREGLHDGAVIEYEKKEVAE